MLARLGMLQTSSWSQTQTTTEQDSRVEQLQNMRPEPAKDQCLQGGVALAQLAVAPGQQPTTKQGDQRLHDGDAAQQ